MNAANKFMPCNAGGPSFESLTERPQQPCGAPYNRWTLGDGTVWATFHRKNDGYLVRFPGLADFEISANGATAICRPCPGLSPETREHLFLNQVQPLMHGCQGHLVFHASAVAGDDYALAFPAASGRGKSTLAAAFSIAGAQYLSDDGLVVLRQDGRYLAQPGHPSIRLWDDSRSAVLKGEIEAAAPVSYTSKARILSAEGMRHCAEPRPLSAAFFLGDGSADDVVLRRLVGAEAVAAWVAHAFILDPEDADQLDRHFREVVDLVEAVPAFRLDYPRRFSALGQVRAAVLDAVSDLKAAP